MTNIDITDKYYTQKTVDPSGIQFDLNRAAQSNQQQSKAPVVDIQEKYADKPYEQEFEGDYEYDPDQVSLGGLDPIRSSDITRNGCLNMPRKTYIYDEATAQNRFLGKGLGYTFGQPSGTKISNPFDREGNL